MSQTSRREFLADVGRGMLVASVGSGLAQDLGLAPAALAEGAARRLTFGSLEPLASLMEETPANQLLSLVVERIRGGTDLKQLVAAAALANARTFGGQDYDGYHTLMALVPAYEMSTELPEAERALPVLKVLYRNTNHIQNSGACAHEALHPIDVPDPKQDRPSAQALREATRRQDAEGAERTFAAIAQGPLDEAYNDLQYLVQDNVNVHRVVLAWRAWSLLDFTGKDYAHTLLRQSVRFCVQEEASIRKYGGAEELRSLLPRLLDRSGLLSRAQGTKQPDDREIDRLAMTIYGSKREQAAEAVATALAEGWSPEAIGEAISLAANRLVLCDPGARRRTLPRSRRGASTAPRWESTPRTRPTPGETSPGSRTIATLSPA